LSILVLVHWQLSWNKNQIRIQSIPIGIEMGGAGFEPAKAMPPDLQSGPFGRLGIHPFPFQFQFRSAPNSQASRSPDENTRRILYPAELAVRLELTTLGLQNRSSAN
jgi:hypothetical protein